jgi:hypothetical protein
MAIHPQGFICGFGFTSTLFFKGGTPSLIGILRKANNGALSQNLGEPKKWGCFAGDISTALRVQIPPLHQTVHFPSLGGNSTAKRLFVV